MLNSVALKEFIQKRDEIRDKLKHARLSVFTDRGWLDTDTDDIQGYIAFLEDAYLKSVLGDKYDGGKQ